MVSAGTSSGSGTPGIPAAGCAGDGAGAGAARGRAVSAGGRGALGAGGKITFVTTTTAIMRMTASRKRPLFIYPFEPQGKRAVPSLRYRVVSSATPRVAAEQSSEREPAAAARTVLP